VGVNKEKKRKRWGKEMEKYIDFKDLIGEIFLVLIFIKSLSNFQLIF